MPRFVFVNRMSGKNQILLKQKLPKDVEKERELGTSGKKKSVSIGSYLVCFSFAAHFFLSSSSSSLNKFCKVHN